MVVEIGNGIFAPIEQYPDVRVADRHAVVVDTQDKGTQRQAQNFIGQLEMGQFVG